MAAGEPSNAGPALIRTPAAVAAPRTSVAARPTVAIASVGLIRSVGPSLVEPVGTTRPAGMMGCAPAILSAALRAVARTVKLATRMSVVRRFAMAESAAMMGVVVSVGRGVGMAKRAQRALAFLVLG